MSILGVGIDLVRRRYGEGIELIRGEMNFIPRKKTEGWTGVKGASGDM